MKIKFPDFGVIIETKQCGTVTFDENNSMLGSYIARMLCEEKGDDFNNITHKGEYFDENGVRTIEIEHELLDGDE